MNNLTHDEINLMCIYNTTGTRQGLIDELAAMRGYLAADEVQLRELTDSAIGKLRSMSDEDYAAMELYPDFDE